MECERGKEKVPAEVEKMNTVRKIRIVYSDPDATDSSSDEDDKILSNGYQNGSSKRIVKEILVPCITSKIYSEKSSQQDVNGEKIKESPSHFASRRRRKSSSMCKDVQPRKPGKCVAENAEEEAAMADERKRNGFDLALRKRDALASNNAKKVLFHPSPSSVLDVSTKAPLDINDMSGSMNGKVNVESNGDGGGGNYVEPVHSEEDHSIQHLLEEPVVPSLASPDFNLKQVEKGTMVLGNEFHNFLDNVGHGEGSILLPVPVDNATDELAWIDETLNWESS